MRKKIFILLLLLTLISCAGFLVYADSFEVTAKIPVSLVGESGNIALFEGDTEIDRITLNGGETGTLSVRLTDLDYFTFTVSQVDMTDPDVEYDQSVYTVMVMTLLDDEDDPAFNVTVYDSEGNEKKDELVFRNYLPDIPQTGDKSSAFLWGCLAAAAMVGAILLLMPFDKKEHRKDEE